MAVMHHKLLTAVLVMSFSGALQGCLSEKNVQRNAAPVKISGALPGPGYTIYAAGDIADCKNRKPADTGAALTASLVARELARDKNAAVLSLGDNTYPVGLLSEFSDCYEPTWGAFKARTHPTPGNHEYGTPQAIGYYTYFGASAGLAQRGYYSFKLGTWHVISLNSNLRNDAHQAQLAWLKKDLARHPAACTLAYWHHPAYSSGGHGNNTHMHDVWQALHAAHADVVLAAHDHDYERFAAQDGAGRRDDAQGMRQFIVGTGGAHLTSQLWRKENSEVFDNSSAGVLKMVLKDSGYEWEFLPVAGGTFTDSGSALCH